MSDNRGLLTAMVIIATAFGGISTAEPRGKKPRLDLRATPRMAFSPVNVLLTAELSGGEETADFYCPEVTWDWDDGGKSVHQEDCAPQESGTPLERRYTANHAYRQAGNYNVKITMRQASRPVAVATAMITVRPGLGDMTANID